MKTKINLIILILLAAITAALLIFAPVKQWLIDLLGWVQKLGFWGPVAVIFFYVIACIFFLPGSILTLGTGFIFKVVVGTITVSIGATLGACAAFLVGRTIARDWVLRKIEGNPKFAAIDNAVAQQGFKIVLLLRLCPIFPFNLLNYAFGLTKVNFWKYALASWIGMLPGTILYVYIGASLRSLTQLETGSIQTGLAGKIFFWAGLAAAIIVTIFITRIAKNALNKTILT